MSTMQDAIKVPLDGGEIELVNNCSRALGVPIIELDVEFADGTELAGVSLADGSITLPGEFSGKSIKKLSIPLEQRVGVRTKGYAAVSDRMNNQIALGTTVMLWMTTGRDEQSKEERKLALQSVRASAGVCVLCGEPLGKIQKAVWGAKKHKECKVYSE